MKTVNLDMCEWCNNLARWHNTTDTLNLDILANFEKVVSCVSWRSEGSVGLGLFVFLFIDPNRSSLSLSLYFVLLYAVWTSNNKWLLIVNRECFLFLSSQHSGNLVPTDYPDHQKKFRMNCHFLSVNFSKTAWAQTDLINRLSGNAFGAVNVIRPK